MKNLLTITIFSSLFFLIKCEPVIPQQSISNKKIQFTDYNYEDIIGNVFVGPIVNNAISSLDNPVINIRSKDRLGISFDLLGDRFTNFSFQLIHCNKNWKKSQLRGMEYYKEINNFRITDFDYSVNTIQPYVNYHASIPKPLVSGNYILSVYRRANPHDVLLTRRIIFYENTAAINQLVRVSTTIDKRKQNQQIEFKINYGNLFVTTPSQEIYPVVLQNHNWNTAIKNLIPTLIKANEGSLEYRYLDLTTNFAGWNEFRFIDLRTLNIAGRNISKITTTANRIEVVAYVDKPRTKVPYSLNYKDINGRFSIENADPGESPLNADYATVKFQLNSEKMDGGVYLIGRFNNWRMDDKNRMYYNEQENTYATSLYLKQGYYEYLYAVKGGTQPNYFIEGSHLLTENEYEILIYYRRPGNVNDEVIGYKRFSSLTH